MESGSWSASIFPRVREQRNGNAREGAIGVMMREAAELGGSGSGTAAGRWLDTRFRGFV
jgi:hypothetical protein